MSYYARRPNRAACRRLSGFGAAWIVAATCFLHGCYSIQNGWLDPAVLGNFQHTGTKEIRTSLTLEDTPMGIPGATFPTRADLVAKAMEYPIQGGDVISVEVNELRERFVPYVNPEVTISATGFVNLPVVGRVHAAGLTVEEFEESLSQALIDREILRRPEVTVNPVFLQKATYSVFGIGVSAANNAPLRAGTFPIRRPDLRILEAINQVGGLNEFVTDIFIFRDEGAEDSGSASMTEDEGEVPAGEGASTPSAESTTPVESAAGGDVERRELIDAIEKPAAGKKGDDHSRGRSAPARDGVDNWVYVDGEFVRAQDRDGVHMEHARQALVLDAATPTVNWSRIAGETDFRILRIPADQLRDGNPEANIYIRAGDVIRIVSGEIGVYYVMGQVARVGAFAFNSEPITLKSAIAAAGGLAPLAWPDRCTVYRRVGQREQMIQVDLDQIFAGQDADFLVRRGDIINVGTHPLAPFLQRIRAATLPTISNVLGYGFSYVRNFADVDSYSPQPNPATRTNQGLQLF